MIANFAAYLGPSPIASIAASLASIAAAVAAFFSYLQTRSSKRALWTKMYLAFSERYSDPVMGLSIIRLLAWYNQHPNDFAEIWHENYKIREPGAMELEEARRRLNRFFVDIAKLYEGGFIKKDQVFVLIGHFGLDVYYNICQPMWKKFYPHSYKDYAELLKTVRASYGGSATFALSSPGRNKPNDEP